jgi:hypothetical protein
MARAGTEQGVFSQDCLKQDVSRQGHRDVFMPGPERTPLATGQRPKKNLKQDFKNIAGVRS